MKEISHYCDGAVFDHTFDLNAWLNMLIYRPLKYKEPINVFREALKGKYS